MVQLEPVTGREVETEGRSKAALFARLEPGELEAKSLERDAYAGVRDAFEMREALESFTAEMAA